MTTRDTIGQAEAMTVAEFEYRRPFDADDELSQGLVVREPGPGARHGIVAARLFAALERYTSRIDGGVLVFNSGFVLQEEPATVRIPDVAFVSTARVPGVVPSGFWRLAPDLAVEVVSPANRASDMQLRVLDYLQAGTRQFWIVDPESCSVTVYRSRSDIRLLTRSDELTCAELLPGFRLRLSELF